MPRLIVILVATTAHPLLLPALRRHLALLPNHAEARVLLLGAGTRARPWVDDVAPGLGRTVADGWPLGLALNQVLRDLHREASLDIPDGRVIIAPALSLPQPTFHAAFTGRWARAGACHLSHVADLPMEARRRTADELTEWQPGADGGMRAMQMRRQAWRKSRWQLWPVGRNREILPEPDAAFGCFARDLFAINGCNPSARTLREVISDLISRLGRVRVQLRHLPPDSLLWRINLDPATDPPPRQDAGSRLWSPLLGIVERTADDLRVSFHGGEPPAASTLTTSAGGVSVPCELHMEALGFGRRLPLPTRQVQTRVGVLVPGASPAVMHRERLSMPTMDLLLTPKLLPTDLKGLARAAVTYDAALAPRPHPQDDAASYMKRHLSELRRIAFRALRMREFPELARISGQMPALQSDGE